MSVEKISLLNKFQIYLLLCCKERKLTLDSLKESFVFDMTTIKIDNSPNWYEYVFVVLVLLSIVAASLQYIIVLLLVSLMINLLLYSKNANIILSQGTFEIHFKIGLFTYRKFRQRFSKMIEHQETIEFYNDDEIVFSLDVGLAPEDNEVSTISLWSKQKSISLGNRRNCLQVFNKIKHFYLKPDYSNI